MPPKVKIKRYEVGRSKRIGGNYVSKPVSPFKISEASTIIDALFSKNIKKRDSVSDDSEAAVKETRRRYRKKKSSETKQSVHSALENDSLDVKINSTFDNLLQGPVYNEVNIRNKSSLFLNKTDTSSSYNNISEKVQYNQKLRNQKKECVRKRPRNGVKDTSINSGKIKKRKTNPRKLKQLVTNAVIDISDTTANNKNVPKKLHSYLDKSVNYSLIIDRNIKQKNKSPVTKYKCAKKFSSITPVKQIFGNKNNFWGGHAQLIRADNTPKFIHSSTPIVPRNIKINDKLNVSPIAASLKTKCNLTANNSKSLFESRNIDISSIPNIVDNSKNKHDLSSAILINATNYNESNNLNKISENVIMNNKTDLLLPITQKDLPVNTTNKKLSPVIIITEERKSGTKEKCSVSKDFQQKAKPVVILKNWEDKLNSFPITSYKKTGINFSSDNSKSLFESDNIIDISSICTNATANSPILINTTSFSKPNVSHQKVDNEIVSGSAEVIPSVQKIISSVIFDEKENTIKKLDVGKDVKLNKKAVVLLEKLEDIGMSGCKNVVYNLTNLENEAKYELVPVVSSKRISLSNYLDNTQQIENGSFDSNYVELSGKASKNFNKRRNSSAEDLKNEAKHELVPVVSCKRISLSKYLDNTQQIENRSFDSNYVELSGKASKNFNKRRNSSAEYIKNKAKHELGPVISYKRKSTSKYFKNTHQIEVESFYSNYVELSGKTCKNSKKRTNSNAECIKNKAKHELGPVISYKRKSTSKYSKNSQYKENESFDSNHAELNVEISKSFQKPRKSNSLDVENESFDSSDENFNKKSSTSSSKTKIFVLNADRDSVAECKTKNSKNIFQNELVPIVRLEKLALPAYVNNIQSQNSAENLLVDKYSEYSNYAISTLETSYVTKKDENKTKLDNSNGRQNLTRRNSKHSQNSNESFNDGTDNFVENSNSVHNTEITDLCIGDRHSSFPVSPRISVKRSLRDDHVFQIPTSANTKITEERCSKRLSKKNSQIKKKIATTNDNTDELVPANFVTIRRKKVQFNSEPSICRDSENSKPTYQHQFLECKVLLEKIDMDKELKKKADIRTMNDSIKINTNLNRRTILLKPGKQWFRSLSVLRRTQIYDVGDQSRLDTSLYDDSIFKGSLSQISNESVLNDMKNKIYSSNRATLGTRKSLKIINLSLKDTSIAIEDTIFEEQSGYVSTLAHVSILESFDKLSLIGNIDDREETARQIILKRCGQTEPLLFDDCYSSRNLKKCRKIGEGVYGEVFMNKSVENKCRVMKVIPIEGNLVVNGERQKKFEEIISEIIIASELSNLRKNTQFCTNGFAELLQIRCVQGRYPQHLVDLWDLYDEEHGSENDSPEIFTDDQLYIVLELANGGQDLESYRFNNAEQTYALFVQITCSLAAAESALQFEHRDMHWGNILISPTDEAIITFQLKGREFEVATKGVKVSIIDFTLSRMTYDNYCIFNDLAADPDLFIATGDYQFDIYRLMQQKNGNNWQLFEPYTNILWLDYTLEKMIGQVRYLRENTKTHKTFIRRLSQLRKKVLNYNSATELLNSDVFSHVFL